MVDFGYFLPSIHFSLLKYPDTVFGSDIVGGIGDPEKDRTRCPLVVLRCLAEWSVGRYELGTWVLTSAWGQWEACPRL